MTYSLNGIALDNSTFGWILRGPSKPISEIVRNATTMHVPGRDGVVSLPSYTNAVTFPLVVQTPRAQLETLYALFSASSLELSVTADSSKVLELEMLSLSPTGYGPGESIVDVYATVRANHPFWRASTTTTSDAVSLASSSVEVSVFSGISAPITDALVRVKGSTTGLRVTDAGESWFQYSPEVESGDFLLFDCKTKKASIVTSDVWTGGTDVTGDLDYSPNGLRLTPKFTTDPSSRSAVLTVTTTARSSASIQVRGRNAHAVV